jgi:Tfp pilus assembly protein PilF
MLSLGTGAVERAAGYVERLSAAAPNSVYSLRLEAELAMAQKRYRDAAGYYDRVAARSEDSQVTIQRYTAARLSGAKDPEKILLTWLDRHPDDVAVRRVRAEQLDADGNSAAAAKEYENVLTRSPKDTIALNNLAVLYQKQKNPRAEELARAAYDSAPENPMIADTYGWLLAERGELTQAVGILRKAAGHPAATAEIQYHFASALARKGDRDEAIGVLRKVTAMGGTGNVKADASRLLAELEG